MQKALTITIYTYLHLIDKTSIFNNNEKSPKSYVKKCNVNTKKYALMNYCELNVFV